MRCLFVIAAAVCCGASELSAVVIASGDGSGNTTAPPDDPGFENIGGMGSGSVVYLGDRWILTAAHLGTGVTAAGFDGTNYNWEPGTETRLSNPAGSGLSGVVDLRMARLDSDPGLPALTIASAAPSAGEDVIMAGRGKTRQASDFHWDVTVLPDPDPDIWTEVMGPPADASGFKSDGAKIARWGENEVDEASLVVNTGWGDTQSFSTQFDAPGMTHEAQGANGDSGGGVFVKRGGSWELIGLMHSISVFDGQPGDTAVYGNKTNAADLSFYRDEILAVMAVPEPATASLVLAVTSCLSFRRRR